MIPFSTKLFTDCGRILYCNEINNDSMISGAVARNTGIPEEMSRVD